MKRPLNIALLSKGFLWSGGSEFLRNLANALLSVSDERQLRLFLLLPVRNRVDSVADLIWVAGTITQRLLSERKFTLPLREPLFEPNLPDYFRSIDGKLEIVEYNETTGLIPALKKFEADVVIPVSDSLGRAFPFPWVGYVYDFQHKYYPDYFSPGECMDRDIHFATMLRDAKAVVVNARSVKDDIEKFFPYSRCKVFNLPFSASPVSSWFEAGNPELQKRYRLPSRYFLISNQFWIHKSHITAFRALAILKGHLGYTDLHIVCTGKMEDYRWPDHIQDLRKAIHDLGIEDRVHLLGHIPKLDQIAIMKKSLAVLQPTQFEGGPGGGAVYDAISLGIPAIVSDIPVNREIEKEENVFYFEAGSETNLARVIRDFLELKNSRLAEGLLIERGVKRKRQMGEELLAAVNYVLEITRK